LLDAIFEAPFSSVTTVTVIGARNLEVGGLELGGEFAGGVGVVGGGLQGGQLRFEAVIFAAQEVERRGVRAPVRLSRAGGGVFSHHFFGARMFGVVVIEGFGKLAMRRRRCWYFVPGWRWPSQIVFLHEGADLFLARTSSPESMAAGWAERLP